MTRDNLIARDNLRDEVQIDFREREQAPGHTSAGYTSFFWWSQPPPRLFNLPPTETNSALLLFQPSSSSFSLQAKVLSFFFSPGMAVVMYMSDIFYRAFPFVKGFAPNQQIVPGKILGSLSGSCQRPQQSIIKLLADGDYYYQREWLVLGPDAPLPPPRGGTARTPLGDPVPRAQENIFGVFFTNETLSAPCSPLDTMPHANRALRVSLALRNRTRKTECNWPK